MAFASLCSEMRRLLLSSLVLAVLVFPASAGASVQGLTSTRLFTRPADSPCVSTTGANSATNATGIAWDGTELLISCWKGPWVDKVSPSGAWLGRLKVVGLPGQSTGLGLGAIAWDASRGRLWGCAITGDTQGLQARSNHVGYVHFDKNGTGSWIGAGTAPHGCVNNVEVVGDQIWADGAYAGSNGTSTWIDAGPANPLNLTGTFHPFTASGHVSGALPDSHGKPLWEADNSGTTKTIWRAGTQVASGTLRFEQLTCDKSLGRVYVKWFNQNRFGFIDGRGC